MEKFYNLLPPFPSAPDFKICWEEWENSIFKPYVLEMCSTPQHPAWHGEGDVFTHTKMVCECLVKDTEFRLLDTRSQRILFLSAFLHDIGKPTCTVLEDGVLVSPRHAVVGQRMVRNILYEECGLCGESSAQSFRETVCFLVRHHSTFLHVTDSNSPERKLIQLASFGEVAKDFNLHLLSILVRADVNGRISSEDCTHLEDVECACLLAQELNVFYAPYLFPNEVTKRKYLCFKPVSREYPLYDDSFKEVIIFSGLPGTGKDTYIKSHYPDLPVISLDEIRLELGISPGDKSAQAKVVSVAKERARVYLREKQPFIWNATSLNKSLRQTLISLFEDYGAFTRIIYLETTLQNVLERNAGRSGLAVVPEEVIFRMLSKLEPPLPDEACVVEWVIT